MREFQCKMDCPIRVQGGKSPCCLCCSTARKHHITESNEHLWTEGNGFLGEAGCKLRREDMPVECREYDCKKYIWVIQKHWSFGKWRVLHVAELESGKRLVTKDIDNETKNHTIEIG